MGLQEDIVSAKELLARESGNIQTPAHQSVLIDLIEKLASQVVVNTGSDYIAFSREFTQAEVRTLNTANGSYGPELLPTLAAGKAYVIINPLIITKATGGTYATADLWIYPFNASSATYLGTTNSARITPSDDIQQLDLEADAFLKITDAVHLWSSVQQAAFEGTWEVIFQYKVIDINE